MSHPRDTLKTKYDECVLEKFFNEYIQPWFQNKSISPVTYYKARKEVNLLIEKKKQYRHEKTETCRMNNPHDTLKTKDDECVLEKFFYEYIQVWFKNKSISPVTYYKARKEVDLLKEKKKQYRHEKTESPNILRKDDVLEVQKLEAADAGKPHQNAKYRSMPAKPEKMWVQSTRMQPNGKETEPRHGQQDTYSKEEIDVQHVILENIELKNKIEKMKEELAKVRADADVEMSEKDKKLEMLKKHLENARTQVEELTFRQKLFNEEERDLQQLILENVKLMNKIEKMKEKLSKARADADAVISEKDQELEKYKKAADIAKTQVKDSTFGLQMIDGGEVPGKKLQLPNLSDVDRPTEIGRKFVEIYDNEWLDAFECFVLYDEEKTLGILNDIVMNAFSFCERKFEEQTAEMKTIMMGLPKEAPQAVLDDCKIVTTTQIHNSLKDLRKQMSPVTAKNIADDFLSTIHEQYLRGFRVKKHGPAALHNYARKCAELCWLMVVCDPPMALSENEEGIDFDTNVYRPYTLSVRDMKRPVVKQHVWPALYLHVAGPLVEKGVAKPHDGKK